MKQNMGTADRVIRTVVALVIVALYLTGRISGTLAIVLAVVGAVFIITSAVAFCPGYLPFGISTRKAPPSAPAA